MKIIALAAMLLLAGAADAMSVADFLGKADALRAKGPFALLSSDLPLLKREGEAAVRRWHDQVAPAGRKPNACPPKGKLTITDDDFMGALTAVPERQRATTGVDAAIVAGFNRRYPC